MVAVIMWGISFMDCSVYIVLPVQIVAGLFIALFIYEKLKLNEYIELRDLVLHSIKRK